MTGEWLGLFEGWGIEIERMIVDRTSLDVRPIADELLRDVAQSDEWVEDFEDGPVGISNELVAHVIEQKNVAPAATIDELVEPFEASTKAIDDALRRHGARLMPTAMHPWMCPSRETKIWPHESRPIYEAYHRLFDCHRHGWANLQSVHLNLSFDDDDAFGRLMAAVRLVLPIVPALAASSPVVDGRITGMLDSRIDVYRSNSSRVPAVSGEVIPEPIFREDEYRRRISARVTEELAAAGADPLLLGSDWGNARGAIARFDRHAIEIRLIDAQECPRADLAVCAAIGGAVRALVEERWSDTNAQRAWASSALVDLLARCSWSGPAARMPAEFVAMFGADGAVTTAGGLWKWLVSNTFAGPAALEAPVERILRDGTLAERIVRELAGDSGEEAMFGTYERLCDALVEGVSFGR
ncbi:MAG: glutamate--cysteine ligase [Planctomycetes bacterium]|nr:glutamate--cysteine ligase [Planctomycetota bacterium]